MRGRGARPMNRILLAQRITLPQMFVSVAVVALHLAANHLLIHRLGWGYLGAAWATSLVRRSRCCSVVRHLQVRVCCDGRFWQ